MNYLRSYHVSESHMLAFFRFSIKLVHYSPATNIICRQINYLIAFKMSCHVAHTLPIGFEYRYSYLPTNDLNLDNKTPFKFLKDLHITLFLTDAQLLPSDTVSKPKICLDNDHCNFFLKFSQKPPQLISLDEIDLYLLVERMMDLSTRGVCTCVPAQSSRQGLPRLRGQHRKRSRAGFIVQQILHQF